MERKEKNDKIGRCLMLLFQVSVLSVSQSTKTNVNARPPCTDKRDWGREDFEDTLMFIEWKHSAVFFTFRDFASRRKTYTCL